MNVTRPTYMAIEGVIGVGKTTLARMLNPVFGGEVILEVFEENPFLSEFYADRERYAFQTQIFFLLSRYHQQLQNVEDVLVNGSLITDYTFEKDRLFALVNLSGDELATYDKVHEALAERIPQPDLVVYLRARVGILMNRIAARDRPYERAIKSEYIETLQRAYDCHFLSPVQELSTLTIDTNDLDFVTRQGDFNSIVAQIRSALSGVVQSKLPMTINEAKS